MQLFLVSRTIRIILAPWGRPGTGAADGTASQSMFFWISRWFAECMLGVYEQSFVFLKPGCMVRCLFFHVCVCRFGCLACRASRFSFFQISLRLLACWFLDVVFQVMFRITIVSEANVVTFFTQDCHWSCLVPLFLAARCLHFGAVGSIWVPGEQLGGPWEQQ